MLHNRYPRRWSGWQSLIYEYNMLQPVRGDVTPSDVRTELDTGQRPALKPKCNERNLLTLTTEMQKLLCWNVRIKVYILYILIESVSVSSFYTKFMQLELGNLSNLLMTCTTGLNSTLIIIIHIRNINVTENWWMPQSPLNHSYVAVKN